MMPTEAFQAWNDGWKIALFSNPKQRSVDPLGADLREVILQRMIQTTVVDKSFKVARQSGAVQNDLTETTKAATPET